MIHAVPTCPPPTMKRPPSAYLQHALSAIAALALCAFASLAQAAPRTITCMEMIGGVPSEPVVYRLDDQGRFFNSANEAHPDVLLSVFDKETALSKGKDDKGTTYTFAQHEWLVPESVLKRRVWWVRDGKKIREFADEYDFARQQVRDGKGRDSCYHSAYKP